MTETNHQPLSVSAVPKEINIDFTQMQLEIDLLAKRVEELEKNAPNAQQKNEKNESNE